jgi:hypothetical protein
MPSESATLRLVIPTEAQRSGGTCCAPRITTPCRVPHTLGLPVGLLGTDELHAAFLNERRTRGTGRRCVPESGYLARFSPDVGFHHAHHRLMVPTALEGTALSLDPSSLSPRTRGGCKEPTPIEHGNDLPLAHPELRRRMQQVLCADVIPVVPFRLTKSA